MSSRAITPPYPIFTDTDGSPLGSGYIYVGAENLDPVTNPIAIYWDEALTIPASQPVSVLNGYPSRAGSPSQFFADSRYSILAKNKNGVAVYSASTSSPSPSELAVDLLSPDPGDGASLVAYMAPYTGSTATTVQKMLDQVGSNLRPDIIQAPSAPSVAVGGGGPLTGAYEYAVSFYTANAETEVSGASASVSPSAQNVNLTNIPVSSDPLVVGRKIYRTYVGAGDVVLKKLVATIADNVTTSYTDSISDPSLGAACPRINSTGGNSYMDGVRNFYDGPGTCAAFGSNTMPNNTGYANSAFGPNALTANTTGYRNCAFGIFSLYLNTTGARNTAYGIHTLNYNTTHGDNTSFGYAALMNADADNNCAFGSNALNGNVSGDANSAFGAGALQFNTSSNNSAFGFNASYANTSGLFNSSFGMFANKNGTTGNFNSAFGYTALQSNVTGSGNTAFGSMALNANLSDDNCAFGKQSGQAITTGYQNTAFGSSSLQANRAGFGNVCFGHQAGYYETGSNKLFIDNQARASEADARLKALIYGIFDAAIANQSVQINGKFAVNGATPQAKAVVNAAATDLATAIALLNQIRSLLIANGQAQ